MHKILQYSIGIKDDDNSTLEEVFAALKKFIRSKRNILLDKVDFERCRQREGEDFETFFINVQQASIDAELTKEHCEDCAKQ